MKIIERPTKTKKKRIIKKYSERTNPVIEVSTSELKRNNLLICVLRIGKGRLRCYVGLFLKKVKNKHYIDLTEDTEEKQFHANLKLRFEKPVNKRK